MNYRKKRTLQARGYIPPRYRRAPGNNRGLVRVIGMIILLIPVTYIASCMKQPDRASVPATGVPTHVPAPVHKITLTLDPSFKVGIYNTYSLWTDPHYKVTPVSVLFRAGDAAIDGLDALLCPEGTPIYVEVVFVFGGENRLLNGSWQLSGGDGTLMLTEAMWCLDTAYHLGGLAFWSGPNLVQIHTR